MKSMSLAARFTSRRRQSACLCLLLLFATGWLAAQEPAEIDIVVLYTPGVETYHGGAAGVQAHVQALVAGANLGFADSGVHARLRLTASSRVNYTESSLSLNDDLSRLWNSSDGHLDEAHQLQADYGADLVCLLRKGSAGGSAGSGYILQRDGGRSDVAYTVVATEYASTTFLHEIGHNLGANHARNDSFDGNPAWGGLYPWSNGYRFEGADGQTYRTIMAYAPGAQLMRFSNPGLAHAGAALGRAASDPASADNARTLNATAPWVAAYRSAAAPAPMIVSQPADQSVRPGGVAVFEVETAHAQAVEYQWWEGDPEGAAQPLGSPSVEGTTARLVLSGRTAATRIWVVARTAGGSVRSDPAQLHIADDFPPVADLDFQNSDHAWKGGSIWQDFVPAYDYLDHVRLRLFAEGAPVGTVEVSVLTAQGIKLATQRVSAAEVGRGDWTLVPLRTSVTPGQRYRLQVNLGSPVGDAVFGLRGQSGNPHAGGNSSQSGYDFAFSLYGVDTAWYVRLDPAETVISDYREAVTVGVESNFPWDVEVDGEPFFAIVKERQSDYDGQIQLIFKPHREGVDSFAERTAELRIGDQRHIVTQRAITPTVALASAQGEIPAAGGEYLLGVSSNFEWKVASGTPAWLRYLPDESGGDPWQNGDTLVRFEVDPNPGESARSASIRIFDQEHRLTQAGTVADETPGAGGELSLRLGGAAFARFEGVHGDRLTALYAAPRFPDAPDTVEELGSFELVGTGENFGVRAWAWLVPEVSGSYTFWIASDDEGALSLSSGSEPGAAAIIARVPGHTARRGYDKYPEQRSGTVELVAGRAYYLEAHMQQGWSGVNLSVAWQGPGTARQVIPGRVLGLPAEGEAPGDEDAEWPAEPSGPPATGGLNFARFDSVSGETLDRLYDSPRFPDSPDSIERLERFRYPGGGDNFGMFAWGWLVPEVTGDYTFWLASDDQGELLLSDSADPSGAVRIARVATYTQVEQFERFPEQRSAPVRLEAGQIYYIAAAAKQGWGGSHLAVAWQGPGFNRQIIPGEALATDPGVGPGGEEQSAEGGAPELLAGGPALARYDGVSGSTLDRLHAASHFPQQPSVTERLPAFDHQTSGANFGLFAWAWLVPEESGEYTFWLASDDQGELRLSPTHSAADAEVIASVSGHTGSYQYEKFPQQRSASVYLEARRAYYLDALVQQGWGSVHLTVAWQGPGFSREVIPGRVLALPTEAPLVPGAR